MKKFSFISLGLLMLSASFPAFASRAGAIPSVSLSGGKIEALGKLRIDLSKLKTISPYRIRCDVTTSDEVLLAFSMQPGLVTDTKVNSQLVTGMYGIPAVNLTLQKGNNTIETIIRTMGMVIELPDVPKILPVLELTNFDDTATLEVSNCSATPISG